ncbi:MAG: type II toxin-antitoxin system VapC family toxin [Saprospiraceae bacterium]|nr:type II toxin-antitoxin system VapC family toxin [Saprospiraceae bacterium]
MADKKLLIDTNILVYANTPSSPLCQTARNKLLALAPAYHSFWISRQSIREYMVVMTNLMKIAGKIDHKALLADVNNFLSTYEITDEIPPVTSNLVELVMNHELVGKKIHDANLVANMLAFDIDSILTNNVDDFQPFSHLISIRPLI